MNFPHDCDFYWCWWKGVRLSIVLNIDKFKRKLYVQFNFRWCVCADLLEQQKKVEEDYKKKHLTSKCAHVCEIVHLSVHYWNTCNAKNEYSLENGNFNFKYTHTPRKIHTRRKRNKKKHLSRRRFAIDYNRKWIYSNETIRLFFFYSSFIRLRLHPRQCARHVHFCASFMLYVVSTRLTLNIYR